MKKIILASLLSSQAFSQVIVPTEEREVAKMNHEVAKSEVWQSEGSRRNHLYLLWGFGTTSYEYEQLSPTKTKISNIISPIFGVGYDRSISKEFTVGGQVLSNTSIMATMGFKF